MNEKLDFTIGADPEFVCLDETGSILNSGDIINDSDENMSDFGSDGNGITFEVRPQPNKNPLKVISNIHKIFTKTVLDQPIFFNYTWHAGSYKEKCPLGGHIHFGIKTIDTTEAVSYLDNYLGSTSMLIENRGDGMRRRRDGYGAMGDYRTQDHGFEYRVTSSWLTSPYVGAAMLCLSKMILFEIINNKEHQLRNDYVHRNTIRELDNLHYKFPEIWKDITQMKLYQKYKPYVDIIYFLVKNRLSWIPSVPMKEVWGILSPFSINTRKVPLGVIWNRYNPNY